MVADPRKFLWESTYAEAHGHEALSRLRIDDRTLVSDINHRLIDLAWEDYRIHQMHQAPRGSTGRGITPAYLDEVGQFQIFYSDFLGSKDTFFEKDYPRSERAMKIIQHVCQVSEANWYQFFKTLSDAETKAHTELIKKQKLPAEAFDFTTFLSQNNQPYTLNTEKLAETYWQVGQALRDNIVDVRELILKAKDQGQYIIGEFGQAYWLDKRHGFSPNVTASHTFTPEFFQSAGIPVPSDS